ncbi:hypothetical protein V1525DRAFT_266269 [Lipomyces kononenkoae]|uniref:Uncharacterized protein n=1 Tax=Lipomyces kononenkoae TaxID=34357 RepID=A0ACC3T8N6_LIPKO
MVRRVGRSRGCATCRKRKIKCDERIPHCSQCLASGLPCPGALVGNVFLNVTHDLAERPGANPGAEFKPVNICQIVFVDEQSTCGSLKHDKGPNSKKRRRKSSSQERAPELEHSNVRAQDSLYRPIFEQQVLGQFIDYLVQSPGGPTLKKWMTRLPDLISREDSPTLKYAIRAASMVLCGFLKGDTAIQMEACRWYVAGLESQQQELLRLKEAAVSEGEVCATMLLSFYETIRSTSSDAWMYHMRASSRLVELGGPEGYRTGLAHELFRALRLYMVYVSTSKRQPSFLATELWLSSPFWDRPKSHFDKLLDIHTVIPIYLAQVDDIISLRDNDAALTPPSDLRANLLRISSALQEWRTEYVGEISNHSHSGVLSEGPSHTESVEISIRSGILDLSPYQDAFTAETIALYDSCCILVAQMLLAVSPPSYKTVYDNVIISHAASILLSVSFISHEQKWNNVVGPFRLQHPLKVVATSTPCAQQRNIAISVLDNWQNVYGFEVVTDISPFPA